MKISRYCLLLFLACILNVFFIQVIECAYNKDWDYLFLPFLGIICIIDAIGKTLKNRFFR